MLTQYSDYLTYELARSPHTVEAYMRDLRQFIGFCRSNGMKDFDPAAITPPLIRRWISGLAAGGEASASIRRKTQSLRAYFKFLCRRKGLKSNPADEIILAKIPKPLPDFIADTDLQRLLRNNEELGDNRTPLEIRDHLILHLLYATGLRRSELLSLTDDSISPSRRLLKVTGKGSKDRIVPLADELLREIAAWQTIRDSEYPDLPAPRPIIATLNGAMSATRLETIIKRLLKGEKAGRKSPHTLRHTFATSMLNGGADLNTVRSILGHSSLATTQIYTHLQFSDIRDIYAKAHPRGEADDETPEK